MAGIAAMTVLVAACAPWPVRPVVRGGTTAAAAQASPGSSPAAASSQAAISTTQANPVPAALSNTPPVASSLNPAPPAASQQPAAEGKAADIVRLARDELGVPYHYGGTTPRGFDCSGLVYYVLRRIGITAPRTANGQFAHFSPVTRADLQPGDLVFFRIAGEFQLHVGIFTGDGEFIHAPRPGQVVSYARLNAHYWKARYAGARRF